jgi:hypothetical protein
VVGPMLTRATSTMPHVQCHALHGGTVPHDRRAPCRRHNHT